MKYLALVVIGTGCAFLQAERGKPWATVPPVPIAKILPGKIKKVDARTLRSEIEFWSDRMRDHTIYLQNSLDNPRLKAIGKTLQEEIEDIRKQLLDSASVDKSLLQKYKTILKRLRLYKRTAAKYAKQQKMKALPALIKHMIEELDYHVDTISGITRTSTEERGFWARHDAEVASLKQLIPTLSSTESAIINKLDKLGLSEHESLEDAYAAGKQETKSNK
jgi:hypothetical protein